MARAKAKSKAKAKATETEAARTNRVFAPPPRAKGVALSATAKRQAKKLFSPAPWWNYQGPDGAEGVRALRAFLTAVRGSQDTARQVAEMELISKLRLDDKLATWRKELAATLKRWIAEGVYDGELDSWTGTWSELSREMEAGGFALSASQAEKAREAWAWSTLDHQALTRVPAKDEGAGGAEWDTLRKAVKVGLSGKLAEAMALVDPLRRSKDGLIARRADAEWVWFRLQSTGPGADFDKQWGLNATAFIKRKIRGGYNLHQVDALLALGVIGRVPLATMRPLTAYWRKNARGTNDTVYLFTPREA